MLEHKIKKLRIRCIVMFIVMIIIFIMFSLGDSNRLFFINKQKDTINVKEMTIVELSEKINAMTDELNKKEKEIDTLKKNISTLKKILHEKINNPNKPIDSLSIIIGTTGDVIQIGK